MNPVPSTTNEAFLRLMFGDADWHRVSVCSVPDLGAPAWPARAARDAFPLDPTWNNYFCVSLMRDPTSRTKEEFEALRVLVLDDVGPKGDPVKIRAALGEPTYRLRTSPLNEQWGYRLDPWVTDRTRAERLQKRVVNGLYGGKDPGMLGVTRVTRLPEGTNTKPHLGKSGYTTLFMATDPKSRSITADMVEAAFPMADDNAVSSTSSPTNSPTPADVDPVPAGRGQARPDPVVLAMRKLGRVLGPVRQSGSGDGWDIICPWVDEHSPTGATNTGTFYFRNGGIKCWHGHCDNRKPEDVRRKVNELLRKDSGGLMGLDDLDPNQLTAVDPATVPPSPVKPTPYVVHRFRRDVVFLAAEDRWLDLTSDTTMNDRALDVLWTPRLHGVLPKNAKGREITPSVWARGAALCRNVEARTWSPGHPLLFSATEDNVTRRYVNGWRDMARPLENIPWSPLEDHVLASDWWALIDALLGPTPEGRDNARRLRNFMAMLVGDVSVKPAITPLIIGPQGAGKEQIWAPFMDVLGVNRAVNVSQAMFNSPFNAWAMHRLVMMPEIRRTTRGTATDHDQYQIIKRMCDAGRKIDSINEKYVRAANVANVFALVMTSNEDRPLTIPDDDRRIWVIRVAASGWTVDRHQKLAAWLERPSPWGATNNHAVVEYMIRYWDHDLMVGEVQGHAPMTRDKRVLVRLGGGPIMDWLEDRLDRVAPNPLALHELITAHELVDLAEAALRSGDQGLSRKTVIPPAEHMGRIMAELGCRKLNQGTPVLLSSGERRRLWAHRDASPNFDTMNSGDLALAWDKSRNRRAVAP